MLISALLVYGTLSAAHQPATPSLAARPMNFSLPEESNPDASASEAFSYTYAEAGLSFGDLTGLQTSGSYAVDGPWLAVANASLLSDSSVDLTTLSGGAGYVLSLQEDLDFVGTVELEYGSIEVDVGPFTFSDSDVGLRGRAGVRWLYDESLEVYGGFNHRTIFDGDFIVDGGAVYHLDLHWDVTAKLEFGDNSLFTVGARYRF